jgi:hypothetical protein
VSFSVGTNKTITLEIFGTTTLSTVVFEGSYISGTFSSIMEVRLYDLSTATQTTTKDEIWQFDVTGLNFFKARISSISCRNLIIKRKAIN